jgi:hypothetical protein
MALIPCRTEYDKRGAGAKAAKRSRALASAIGGPRYRSYMVQFCVVRSNAIQFVATCCAKDN